MRTFLRSNPMTGARRLLAAVVALAVTVLAGASRPADTPGGAPSGAASGTPRVVPAYRKADKVAVLRVEGVIDRFTRYSLERRVARATRDGADAIVLDIDTPGGEMFATMDICHLLQTDAPANSVAWINHRAFSAGTIIAVNCREIVVHPNATFGDAAPIQVSAVTGLQQLAPTERAKLEAPLKSLVVEGARRNGYDENLVQAFVRIGVELWLLENQDTGERIFVTRDEYNAAFGEDPPVQMPAFTPAIAPGIETAPVQPRILERFIHQDGTDEPQAETPEAAARRAEFEASLMPIRDPLTPADAASWRLLAQVVAADELLTVTSGEARSFGLAKEVIETDADLKAFFGATEVVRYDPTWSEALVRVMVSFPVRAVLIVIFLVCLFIELAAPGAGLFGGAALIAGLLLIGAPFLVGMADWWEVLLILVGLVLIAAELFVVPGFGVAGVAGVGCLLVGLVGTFISGDLASPAGQQELWRGLTTTMFSGLVALAIMWMITRHLDSIPVLNRVVLLTELGERGSAPGRGLVAAMDTPTHVLQRGDIGTTETDLRPSGRASFDGRLVDVQSVSGFIDRGVAVRVVTVGRFAIEVEEEADA